MGTKLAPIYLVSSVQGFDRCVYRILMFYWRLMKMTLVDKPIHFNNAYWLRITQKFINLAGIPREGCFTTNSNSQSDNNSIELEV